MAGDLSELGRLLAELPPAPTGWMRAAKELPGARAELASLERLVETAETDAAFRAELMAGLENALVQAGRVPTPELVAALRRRLGG